jgi:cell division protein FtsL
MKLQMKPFLLINCFALGTVLFILFATKYHVQEMENRLDEINASIIQEQENIHILKAEWAYLTKPENLEKMNKQHLGLEPIKPHQMMNNVMEKAD